MKKIKLLMVGAAIALIAAAAIYYYREKDNVEQISDNQTVENLIKGIDRVVSVERMETDHFAEKYMVSFKQYLDHKHPEKGTFTQRVIVCHRGVDRPTILVTEGYGAKYALRAAYQEELSKLMNANTVFVEHRYFLESTPNPKDWQYLTAENSADDLHAVNMAFRSIYKNKWVATGISKGGQTTLLYRTFYPNDVDLSVPYVAPLCKNVEDGRHEPFLKQVGTKEQRLAVEDFQKEVLKRRSRLMPMFKEYCESEKLEFNLPLDEVYDYCVLEYSFALWQWGTPIANVPSKKADDKKIFDSLIEVSSPSYFERNGSTQSFFVQAARELGYYGYDITPFKGMLKIKSSKGYLAKLMLPDELKDEKFDATLSEKIVNFLEENDPTMIFIYGENDPWTAAGVTWLENKKNVYVFMEKGGSHRARISTMNPEQQKEIMNIIESVVPFK